MKWRCREKSFLWNRHYFQWPFVGYCWNLDKKCNVCYKHEYLIFHVILFIITTSTFWLTEEKIFIIQSFSPAIKQGLILHWKLLLFISLLRAPSHRLSNMGLSQYKTTSFCLLTESHWVDSVISPLAKILLMSSFTTFITIVVKKYLVLWVTLEIKKSCH